MWNPMRRTDASGGLVDIIHRGPAALALQAGAARRGRRARARRGRRCCSSAYGLESWRFSAGSILTFRIVLGLALAGAGRLVPRPAAAAAGHGRAGGALSRRARAVAPGGDHQRRRGRAREPARDRSRRTRPRWSERLVESAVEKCQAIDRRPRASSGGRCGATPASLAAIAAATLARVRRSGPAYLRHALSALLDRLAQRRGGGAVPHRSHARQRHGAARRRSDRSRRSWRVRRRAGGADGAQVARRAVRADAAAALGDGDGRHSTRACCSTSPARSTTSSKRPACARDLHAEGRRPAVRAEARARVSLPGLHRPRAAQGRGRRRHRRAARAPRSASTSCRR